MDNKDNIQISKEDSEKIYKIMEKMMNNIEYIQIPKKDFEETCKFIKHIIVNLNLYYGDLKAIENIINEIKKILEDAPNPKIIIKLEVIEELLDSLKCSLAIDHNNLKVYTDDILKKVKKEQIDKKQNE